ncbi:hypothetical protein [Paenibacillus sonchi]|uniref:hypothetical protein n=1 Tax=Paenibacillus sonchi TaxID=373687 RepID=UPI001F39C7FD|nr:hypothetical protein [Paenibacillus sonchi]
MKSTALPEPAVEEESFDASMKSPAKIITTIATVLIIRILVFCFCCSSSALRFSALLNPETVPLFVLDLPKREFLSVLEGLL